MRNKIIAIKKIALTLSIFFVFGKSYTQIINNGSTITLNNDAILFSTLSLVNDGKGSVINNGSIITDSSIINNPGASLSGNGIYTMQSNFTNTGNFTAGTSSLKFTGSNNSLIKNSSGKIYKLQISKKANGYVSINDNEQILNNVVFINDNNYLRLNANNLTLGTNCTVTNFSDKRFFITNGIGTLKKISVGKTAFVFPVGFNASTYNPVTITENGTADDYSVRCLENALTQGSTGNPISKNGIDVSWLINEAVNGGANASINVQWKSADELSGFTAAKCMLVKYANGKWDFNSASTKAATGTTYKNIGRSNLSSFGYFTVLSSSQTSFTDLSGELIASNNIELKVYPTIVHKSFNISVPSNKNVQKMNVVVLNEAGKIVCQKQNANFQSQQITLPSLASGLYVVLINYDNKIFTQKIVVN